jgi:hypothetical protein
VVRSRTGKNPGRDLFLLRNRFFLDSVTVMFGLLHVIPSTAGSGLPVKESYFAL